MQNNEKIESRIQTLHVIFCDYCGTYEHTDAERPASKLAEKILSLGWTINERGAIKCGPCNWKERHRE